MAFTGILILAVLIAVIIPVVWYVKKSGYSWLRHTGISKIFPGTDKERFVALSVKTANFKPSSICQISIAVFEKGSTVKRWNQLINPQDKFDHTNSEIIGIDEEVIKNAPTFPKVYKELRKYLKGQSVVTYSNSDVISLCRAIEKHQLPIIQCAWVNCGSVVMKAWSNLSEVCFNVNEINAQPRVRSKVIEDGARIVGELFLRAKNDTELGNEDWMSTSYLQEYSKSTRP